MKFLVSVLLLPLTLVAVDLKVDCAKPGSWKIETVRVASGEVEEYEFSLSSPVEAVPPRFEVSFDVPQLDAHHRWTTRTEKVTVPPDWSCGIDSRLCSQMPLVAFLNDSDRNRICVSASEAIRNVHFEAGLREEDCRLVWKVVFFGEPEAPLSRYAVRLRIDRRDIFFGDAIREGTDWIVKAGGLKPAAPPPSAFEPLYSTWYGFHQNVCDRDVEAELAEAAKLGMKAVIVDDGWQTDDNNRGYAYTGDWEISKRRFPDMASHVKNVHALGMKYMVWYGVPMMGLKAKNHERFSGKYLWTTDDRWSGYSCMDPRFPEVREYIVSLYEKTLREWDVDGLKLDFIDDIGFRGVDPAIGDNYAGRDIKALPDAVDRLMKEIYSRLKAIKPDVLIEFRQGYVGPAIRQYGNMIRAADCPGDLLANRARTANLRLTSGLSAVHSDMLEWNTGETPENAARFILSSIFSVVQYSVMLRNLPEGQRRMLAHWIRFTREHRDALLKGGFRPHHYEAFYPWIEAWNEQERIVASYVSGMAVPVDASKKVNFILNGTGTESVIVDAASEAKAEIYDTFGVQTGQMDVKTGLNKVKMPISGYLTLR